MSGILAHGRRFRRAQTGHIRIGGALPRRVLIAVSVALTTLAPSASAAAPELSVSDRLDDRRYVASGTRGYAVGVQSGDFPAIGWHTRGEMGGIRSPPLKLLDGSGSRSTASGCRTRAASRAGRDPCAWTIRPPPACA